MELELSKNSKARGGLQTFKLSAVRSTLDEHLLGCNSPARGFYALPVSKIKDAAGASGSAVCELVREAGEAQGIDCIEGVWKEHLFLDLIGAGVLYSDGRSISFLALRTNQPQFVQKIIGSGAMPADINEIGSERLRLFRQIRSKLLAIQPNWKTQSAVQSNDLTVHVSKYYEGTVIMCSLADGTLLNHDGIIPIDGENFFTATFCALHQLRFFFGEGWLPDLSRFAMALDSAMRSPERTFVLVKPEGGSDVKAALSATELLGFGWLADAGSEKDPGSGIHHFKPQFLNTWRNGLPLNDKGKLRQNRRSSFESAFTNDRAVLALKFHCYSNKAAAHKAGLDYSKWRILPMLSATGVSALLRLLPRVSFEVIAFHGGSSQSTDAGVLECVLKLGNAKKERKALALLNDVLSRQIQPLLETGRFSLADGSTPIDACGALEEALSKGRSPLEKTFRLGDPEVPSARERATLRTWLPSVLRNFNRSMGDGEGMRIKTISYFLHGFLGFSLQKAVEFCDAISSSSQSRLYQNLRNRLSPVVRMWRSGPEEKGNESIDGARVPVPRLIEWLGCMCGEALGGCLAVSDVVQDWINRNTRLVIILPADSPVPRALPSMVPVDSLKKPRTGERKSCQLYSLLFGPNYAEGSIHISLEPLLNAARLALIPGSKEQSSGWLAAKCSETNELVVYLMREIGYVGNFDLERVPLEVHKLNNWQLLSLLDSRLIIRAIKSTTQGSELLNTWIANLLLRVQAEISSEIEIARESTKHSSLADLYTARLLDVFLDKEGITAAAIEAARTLAMEREDEEAEGVKVYFRVDSLAATFRPKDSPYIGTPDSSRLIDRGQQKAELRGHFAEGSIRTGNSRGGDVGVNGPDLYDIILKDLLNPNIAIVKVAEAFQLGWVEENHHGDTPEDFIAEYAKTIEERDEESRSRLVQLENRLRSCGFLS